MRKAMIVGMMALAGYGAGGGQGAETTGHQVTVYLQDHQIADPLLLARAKALTTSMFAGVGVRLRWEVDCPRPARGCQELADEEIGIRFASRTPGNFQPGALAYSHPYAPQSEVRVTILYDRVLGTVAGNASEAVAFLGHVLAHEIGHVLQGVAQHSATGVMKAQWTLKDRAQMRKGPLPFSAYDAELIQRAMASGKSRGRDSCTVDENGRRKAARSAAGGAIIPPAIEGCR